MVLRCILAKIGAVEVDQVCAQNVLVHCGIGIGQDLYLVLDKMDKIIQNE